MWESLDLRRPLSIGGSLKGADAVGSNAPSSSRPWFSTKGQVADLVLKILLAVLAGKNALPQMSHNQLMSTGALLFYGIAATLLISVCVVVSAIWRNKAHPTHAVAAVTRTPVETLALNQAWVRWAAIADEYDRLDYDNRNNNSTRLPFNHASWPDFGQPWKYVHAQLHRLADKVDGFKGDTEALFIAFGWTDSPAMPTTHEAVVMVEFLREVRELQTYLEKKRGEG